MPTDNTGNFPEPRTIDTAQARREILQAIRDVINDDPATSHRWGAVTLGDLTTVAGVIAHTLLNATIVVEGTADGD